MSDDTNIRNPQNIAIRRNRKYESIVEKLCSRKTSFSDRPIFSFNKDLMVFAAVLGHTLNKKEKLEPESIQITLGTYSSDEKDGYIYLLALLENRDITILKEENISDGVKIFEEYCNGGLSEIKTWIDDNPSDIEGVDTLASKIFDQLVKCSDDGGNEKDRADVIF